MAEPWPHAAGGPVLWSDFLFLSPQLVPGTDLGQQYWPCRTFQLSPAQDPHGLHFCFISRMLSNPVLQFLRGSGVLWALVLCLVYNILFLGSQKIGSLEWCWHTDFQRCDSHSCWTKEGSGLWASSCPLPNLYLELCPSLCPLLPAAGIQGSYPIPSARSIPHVRHFLRWLYLSPLRTETVALQWQWDFSCLQSVRWHCALSPNWIVNLARCRHLLWKWSYFLSLPLSLLFWWQCVEGRGMINIEKGSILGM